MKALGTRIAWLQTAFTWTVAKNPTASGKENAMTRLSRMICVWLLVASTTPAMAQDEVILADHAPGDAAVPEAGQGIGFTFAAGGVYQFETDIDNGGEFSVTRGAMGFGVNVPLDDNLMAIVGLGYEADAYDFGTPNGLAAMDPWDTIHTVRLRGVLEWQINERWSLSGGPVLTYSGEGGADFDDSVTGGGTIAVGYRFNDKLWVRGGVGIFSQTEDDAAVFPIIQFNWQFAPQWSLRTGSFDLGSEGGAGLEVAWAMNETLEISGGAQWQTRRFRLDNDAVAPNGVGEENMVPLYLRLTWRPAPTVDVSGFLGTALGGELRLENSSGDKISEEDYDPAAVIGGRVTLRF